MDNRISSLWQNLDYYRIEKTLSIKTERWSMNKRTIFGHSREVKQNVRISLIIEPLGFAIQYRVIL